MRLVFQLKAIGVIAAMFCASQAFGAVVSCGVHESPISCQQRADTAALNERAYAEGARVKAEFNRDITAARAKFWATYPDKPGFEAARDKFVEMLRTKDMYFLILRSMAAIGNSAGGAKVNTADYSKLGDLYVGGTPLDNGISRPSDPEFTDWADTFAKNLQANGGVFTLQAPANAYKALAQSEKEYERYILARDWGEFDLLNRIPVGYEAPRNYAAMLYFRFGHVPQQTGFDIVTSMVKTLGADVVDSASNQVKAAPKEHDGTLKVTVAEPVRIGPGGTKLPDDTIPMPSQVIGFYVGQLRAFEELATRGDDRRYLLGLIGGNTSTPGEKSSYVGKWDRAAKAYDRYVFAFGEPEVLGAARKVRTAVKRMTDLYVMDPQALGSTRMAPYAAFEDVLTRQDPRGYVRSMLAFAKNANSKADVDAAYRDFMAGKTEAAVIETAAKMAAYRPEPALDLETLTKAVNGTISVDKPVQTMVDDWQYTAWKGFSPGAQSTYISRGLVPDRPGSANLVPGHVDGRATFKLQSINEDQARLWLTEIAYNYPDYRATPPHDTEIAYASKHPAPKPNPSVSPTVESGQETLTVGGRQLASRWQSVSTPRGGCTSTTKVWLSDEVPGGVVRKLQSMECAPAGRGRSMGRNTETILESFQGARQPGFTDVFEERAVESAAAPATAVPNIYTPAAPSKGRTAPAINPGTPPATPSHPSAADTEFTDPAYPNYYLTDQSATLSLSHYCNSLYHPPLLTAEQNQMLYKNGAIVQQDIQTCIGWFDVKEVRANRKQAMRFCLTNNNFAARGQGARRASYDACMNQNDIVTALCTQELNVRAALDRNYRGQVYSCPAAAPASYGESAVVLQGGHEDTVPLMIAAPGLPPLLQAPLPKGLLRGGTPLPKR